MAKCRFCKIKLAPDADSCPACGLDKPTSLFEERSTKFYFDKGMGHGKEIKERYERQFDREININIQSESISNAGSYSNDDHELSLLDRIELLEEKVGKPYTIAWSLNIAGVFFWALPAFIILAVVFAIIGYGEDKDWIVWAIVVGPFIVLNLLGYLSHKSLNKEKEQRLTEMKAQYYG